MNLNELKNVHCIGIGGIGLSALANILSKKYNISVTGSDEKESSIINQLKSAKIKIFIGHKAENLSNDTDLVIYTSAVPKNNPEIKKAIKKGIGTITYAEGLALLTKNHFTIAVCGTHGKTTTTGMIAKILIDNGCDPTVVIGSKMKEYNNQNYRIGNSDILLIEACEYKKAFLNFEPNIVIVTNIEADHLDFYKNFRNYKNAFNRFFEKIPEAGYLIGNLDDDNIKKLTSSLKCNKIFYGLKKGNFIVKNKKIVQKNKKIGDLALQIPGIHNQINACSAYIAGNILKINSKKILKSLNNYKGTWRRFDEKGYFKNLLVIDDYGHHPTEIKATLSAAKEKYPDKKLLCVFQPHQFSRTKFLLKDFAKSFNKADFIIIPNIYKVRDTETDVKSVNVDKLVNSIKLNNPNVINGEGFEKTLEYIKKTAQKYDILLIMGAGDIYDFSESLIN